MNRLMITYDLKDRSAAQHTVDSQNIKDTIVSLGPWCNYWTTTFLLKTSYSQEQVCNFLTPYMNTNDTLIVVEFNAPIFVKLTLDKQEWIQNNILR